MTVTRSSDSHPKVYVGNGTVSLPSYTFGSDLDTGIYRHGANQIGIAANGVASIVYTTAQGLGLDGGAGSPFYGFASDVNSGMYLVGADRLGFTAGGVRHLELNTTESIVANNLYERKSHFIEEFWNGVGSQWATRTTTGSVAAQGTSNGIYRLTTGAVDDNEESIDWNDICTFQNTLRPAFYCRLKMDQASDIQVRIGLTESVGVGVDDFICLRVNSDTDTNWYLVASDGGAETTDVGPAATTGLVDFKWVFTSDTAIEWFYSTDGGVTWTSQGTVSSNVPTEQLQPFAEVIVRNNGGARYIELDKVEIWQDRV